VRRRDLADPIAGLPTDVVQIQSLDVDPDPPKPGQNLTIHASGTVQKAIVVRGAPRRGDEAGQR
jgi:hypothetical protein